MDTKVRKILEEGKVDLFVAYKRSKGHWMPFIFEREKVNQLEPWSYINERYPVVNILFELSERFPDKRIGILVRGCEEKAIYELVKHNQLNRDKILIVGQACSYELAGRCECQRPYPDSVDYGEKIETAQSEHASRVEKDLGFWIKNFNRCMACFGCRDVCPLCFCRECTLENQALVAPIIPPDITFHLIRAVHLADKCVDCGLCEKVCPAGLPLRLLYREVRDIVKGLFGYESGKVDLYSPFSYLGEGFNM